MERETGLQVVQHENGNSGNFGVFELTFELVLFQPCDDKIRYLVPLRENGREREAGAEELDFLTITPVLMKALSFLWRWMV